MNRLGRCDKFKSFVVCLNICHMQQIREDKYFPHQKAVRSYRTYVIEASSQYL
jgi:hypothetical protein